MSYINRARKFLNIISGNEKESILLSAPLSGKVIALSRVEDPVFSEEILGRGVAIIPDDEIAVSPFDGVVENIPDTKHAIGIKADNGVEILIHIGIETVKLDGKYFDLYVKEGDRIKKGDKLIGFASEKIKQEGYDITTPVVVTNSSEFKIVKPTAEQAKQNEIFMRLEK